MPRVAVGWIRVALSTHNTTFNIRKYGILTYSANLTVSISHNPTVNITPIFYISVNEITKFILIKNKKNLFNFFVHHT